MKFRFLIFAATTLILSACNFSLAEDVTPPPGYVPPTPAPTLGPLYPAKASSTQNGALIYASKCAACHGDTGKGDGKQGIQLGVTVPALGLPEVARPASPAQWYTTVTRGNMERFMPPFTSLNDQERWDVVAYAMSLHNSEEEIAKGKQLFESNCANCSTDFFKNQAKMSALSDVELARILKQGNDQVKPFGAKLSDDDLWAVTAYLRSLSFDMTSIAAAPASSAASSATPESTAVTGALAPAEAGTPVGTPSAEGTPIGTEQVPAATEATTVANAGAGTVSGSIENKTGKDLPTNLKVILHGYDHGADPNTTAPQEVLTQDGTVNADGSFVFQNIELPANRIFIAEVTADGIDLQSDFAMVKAGDTSLSLPPITLYNKTQDTSKLVMDDARILLEYGANGIQVLSVYSFHNTGEEAIDVKLNEKGEIPFIKSPAGSSGFGFQPTQDGEKLVQTKAGFEVPPSKGSYGLVTFVAMPNTKKFEFSQQFVLPVPTVTIFVPEGVKVAGAQSKDLGVQSMQNFNFQAYQLDGITAGQNLKVTISGTPKGTAASTQATPNQNLLIGAGALGVALILAGAWMYLRDRNRPEGAVDEEEEKGEFRSAEDVMDAIIALDDLHRAKKISDGTYQKRRMELKEVLKGMM